MYQRLTLAAERVVEAEQEPGLWGFDADCLVYCRFSDCCGTVSVMPSFRASPDRLTPAGWQDPCDLPGESSPCLDVLVNMRPRIVSDIRNSLEVQPSGFMRAEELVAFLGVPVLAEDGSCNSTLTLLSRRPRQWQPDEVTPLQLLATRVAKVLDR